MSLYGSISFAQSIGIGEVTAIESNVASYETNGKKIDQYKIELPALKRDWDNKVQKLEAELAAMIKERNGIIEDMKVGARCSQCNGWKSEFEKRGENFEKHLGDVKGYAIPATTGEISSKRKEYDEKIAIKRVQLQSLNKGDNAYLKKLRDIEKLEEEQRKICPEITRLSKVYETKVLSNAKDKHKTWAAELMNYTTKKMIAEDRVAINKARAIRYIQEFDEESKRVRELVKNKNEEEQHKKDDQLKQNKQAITDLTIAKKDRLNAEQILLSPLTKQLAEIDTELKQNGYKMIDSLKLVFENRKTKLQQEVLSINQRIKSFETEKDNAIAKLETENKKLSNDIFQLKVDLPKQQQEQVELKRPGFDQKIAAAKQDEQQAGIDLAEAKKSYADKVKKYKTDQGQYSNLIVSESNRMAAAGRKITCSVWNQTNGLVIANWSKLSSCTDHIFNMAKANYNSVFNHSCTDEFVPDLKYYKSFLDGLNNDDRKALFF